jgi:hypothetical protein
MRSFEQARASHGRAGGLRGVPDASTGGALALGRRGALSWRVLLALAALSLALAASLYEGLPGSGSARPGAAPAAGLAGSQRLSGVGLLSLPASAQGSVSAALGGDSAAYRVSGAGAAFSAASPAQHLRSSFTHSGVTVRAGATRVGLSLDGIGYGASLAAVGGVAPRAEGNRVVYARPGLGEWYVNGPLGLEQGFTLSRALAGPAVTPLTLAIGLSGNARAALTNGDQSVTLARAGGVAMRYTGLSATDARGHVLHTWLGLEAGRILLHVDASGASYPLRIDPLLQQGEKLTGGKESGAGAFGYSVALSGNGRTALIGGPDDNGDVGAVWVFTRSGSTWTQQGEKLTGGEESGAGEFGTKVALSADGNTALIGGPGEDGGVGAAWVFTRSGSTWTQQAKIVAKGEVGAGRFGASVALSGDGNTALVGAPEDKSCVGAAWTFTRSGSTWSKQTEFTVAQEECPSPDSTKDWGTSVALSADGNTLVIGGPPPGPFSEGGFWVYARSGSTWSKQADFEDLYGDSAALSANGDTALLGGLAANAHAGGAHVFTREGSTWSPQGEELTSPSEVGAFGTSVSLSAAGTTALVGSPGEAGVAWVFTRENGVWTDHGEKLTGSKEAGAGNFGNGVALSESADTALIGGPADNGSLGAAWVFVSGPGVETGSASEVKPTSAKLGATVDPNEESSECDFEYGTTTAYGKTAACSPQPGSGASPVAVSASLGGLSANTTYHFRIAASNPSGTSHGADQTFTTLATSSSGETREGSKPAEAKDGQLTAIASGGTGTVTVGPYGSDIGGPALPKSAGKYIDAYRAAGSSFAKIEVKDCELGGAKTIWWYNPAGTWEPISEPPAVYTEGSPACITVTLTESTRPSVAELTGTRFGTRFGALPGPLAYGKCEATKDGFYAEGSCVTPDAKNKGTETKGKFEWYANPVGCFPEKHGQYSESACLTLDVKKGKPKGKFESGGGDAFTATGGVAKFEIESVGTLECGASASAGKLTGQKAGTETITFAGCKLAKSECASSGAKAGTIETFPLETFIEDEGEAVDTEVFQDPIMTFTCGNETYTLQGGFRGETTGGIDAMSATSKSVFMKGVGEQELETTVGGKEHKTTMTASFTTTDEQEMEIDTDPGSVSG